ncbi:tyrosine recombinase XerC [Oxalobacter sp. OttesenSCG-928-P03]|nr:tyrosine recombinase XerC [Oxalobacter sp. OttesenSCG-928-P03]
MPGLLTFHSAREAIDAYLDSLLTQRKLSDHTVDNYRRDLLQLHEMAEDIPLEKLTHHQIRRFVSKLHAGGMNPRSIARKLSAWRGFYQWLAEQTGLPANPAEAIKAPRRARTLPKALSVDDAVQLVTTPSPAPRRNPEDTLTPLCNQAMFELLYSSGLRVSELTGLDIHPVQEKGYTSQGWINLDNQEITVTGKGSKTRIVPVGQAAADAIRSWISVREQLLQPQEEDGQRALFINQRGRRMTPRIIQMRLKAHAKMLGLPLSVHPHVLRHSFASHVLQSSGDLRAVQEMLGHASISSTQVYTALDFQHLARIYDATHPRAKKK